MERRVVVGVDGSDGAQGALRWAITMAGPHGATTEAVLVWSLLDQHHADGSDRFDPHYGEEDARRALHHFVVQAVGEGASVEEVVVCDLPVPALQGAAEGALAVAVGRRGKGGFPGLRLGSVGDRLLGRVAAPLAVVGTELRPDGPVVVGVDGSAPSREALRWAVDDARARGAELVVLHAWEKPWLADMAFEDGAALFQKLRADAEALLDELLRDVDTSGITVVRDVDGGAAARRLVEASMTASVVVVGARGLGAVAGTLLGSVSRQVVHHGTCPVVVVPPAA